MKISKSHKRLSELLNNPRVLSNPEEFLGPNFEAVLNFWLILDELSKDQWKNIRCRSEDFYSNQPSEWDKASDEAIKASIETIGRNFAGNAVDAAYDVYGFTAGWATKELIGMHKLFEKGNSLFYFEIILNLC